MKTHILNIITMKHANTSANSSMSRNSSRLRRLAIKASASKARVSHSARALRLKKAAATSQPKPTASHPKPKPRRKTRRAKKLPESDDGDVTHVDDSDPEFTMCLADTYRTARQRQNKVKILSSGAPGKRLSPPQSSTSTHAQVYT